MTTETAALAVFIALSMAAGAALGAIHLHLLRRAARRLVEGRDGAAGLLVGFALRMGLALATLAVAARAGADWPHLLAGLAGFTAARTLGLRRRPDTEPRRWT